MSNTTTQQTRAFTDKQLRNFRSYEHVRKSGHYNMFDSRARAITGLSTSDYVFVMENYEELKEQACNS